MYMHTSNPAIAMKEEEEDDDDDEEEAAAATRFQRNRCVLQSTAVSHGSKAPVFECITWALALILWALEQSMILF